MKRFLSAFLSFVMVISLFGYTAYADTGISCPLVNKHLMKNEDFYNGYALENLVASKSGSPDETFLMLGSVDPETGIITEIPDETVTGTNKMKQLVTRKLLFLPFGSAFTFDSTDVYDANGRKIPNLDLLFMNMIKTANLSVRSIPFHFHPKIMLTVMQPANPLL